jgi:hypothetical protein
VTIHRAPMEPTSDRAPCCGALLADLNPVTDPLTRVDRDVTCKVDELADLKMNPVLAALVDSVRGPRRPILIAKLRQIKEESASRTTAEAANELLRRVGLEGRFVESEGTQGETPHGEPGHQCIPPEALMQVQDSLGNVLQIVEGHKKKLEEAGYPEPVVFGMVSNLHAVLLQRLL